ncbi:serine/threonine-protein kinase [Promicromonospora citrea]|uniref:Protein kinase n=3 Tax=Promicromonospora citrea TaxID=43677 RepID=A0A8H9GJC9_9MICO|nr:serine/threonine-protein kinase [Promicromonospora citrea]GGM31920.1 protein kinase [Promicromonospora citrea]
MIEPLRAGDPAHAGPYVLLGRLAAGGMGQVFVGRSRAGRVVAVKVIHDGLAAGDEFRTRFAREVEAARRVGGFHTAEVVDADAYAARPWMATAYVAGPSLQEAVARAGVLDEEAVRALGAALVGGLAAVHAAGLVHRDLKPANVLLTADGPRVIDFGIARAVDATSVTTSGDVLGTAAYMSPEQVRGQEASAASDVFALGCVLAYACSARSPFGGGPTEAVVYRVVHEEPDLTAVPAGLRDVVAACLAKDPAARPGLDAVLDGLRPPAGRVVPWRLPDGVGALVAERARELRDLPAHEAPAATRVLDAPPTDATRVAPAAGDETGGRAGTAPAPSRRRSLRWALAGGVAAALAAGAAWLVPALGQAGDDGLASGVYALTGEPLTGPDAQAAHEVTVEISTPSDGELVRVAYAGTVDVAQDGGTQQRREGNGDGFTVRTPWTGTIPVDTQMFSLLVTAAGDAEDITCRISLDGEPAAEGTASWSSTCGVPVDTADVLDGLF